MLSKMDIYQLFYADIRAAQLLNFLILFHSPNKNRIPVINSKDDLLYEPSITKYYYMGVDSQSILHQNVMNIVHNPTTYLYSINKKGSYSYKKFSDGGGDAFKDAQKLLDDKQYQNIEFIEINEKMDE